MIAAVEAAVADFKRRELEPEPKPKVGVINMSFTTMPLGDRAGDNHAKELRKTIKDVRLNTSSYYSIIHKASYVASRR